MLARRSLPLLACLLAAAPAQGQQDLEAEVVQRAGLTTVSLEGPLPGAPGPVEGRLVAVDAPAEEPGRPPARPLVARGLRDAQGRCRLQLRTARLLLPGRYAVEVEGARVAFRLGSPEEERAARERMLAWYRGAAGTLRDLAAALERRGAFHLAAIERARARLDGEERRVAVATQRAAFSVEFLAAWSKALRIARMDLATYRRRVVFPPLPEVGRDLAALPPLLATRAEAWTAAVERSGAAAPGPAAAVLTIARRLLAALGEDPARLADWQAGDLASPPPPPPQGQGAYRDPVGFGLTLPEGARALPATSPADRLTLIVGNGRAVVRVQDLPDSAQPAELTRRLEVAAWEGWESYERLSGEPLGAGGASGLRLEFRARLPRYGERTAQYETAHVVQRSLFPAAGRRAVSLLLLWPEGEEPAADLLALEGSFALTEGRE